MKKGSLTGRFFPLLLTSLVPLLAAVSSGFGGAASDAKADALELEDVAAYWAVRGKDREQNNYIHPVVRFRIKNTGTEEAGYIQAMAVFKREAFPDEPWGNDFLYSISETPIAAGSRSDEVTMRSDTNFVSKDEPEQMFQSEKWEKISVSVFLRVGPSSWRPALSLEVPKQIGAPGLQKFLEPEATNEPAPSPR
jgi:hypothetical protein